ncbi:carotenoid oxygenase family protein [Sphaerisporangium sp. TRM90804]|uniref:carotenoid oxygenase family protein n=1 Tax=Sphaerisporangium sp. TRM90804 TaxID=3031113 RepID=UPI0024493480|nr:carotenoid oxygenase family protein [Sphaerisporangium sp. TRM90804]MDH2430885.1 carotenoid oxygenase family protein [Sphaerisporangium sp. TRM90804]
MTVAEHIAPIAALISIASASTPREEPLPVDGTLPPEIDGVYVRVSPYPGASKRPDGTAGRHLLWGVRLSGGTARRAAAATDPDPVAGGSRHASIAQPVHDAATSEWHTVVTYPGLPWAEHLVAGPGGIRAARAFPLEGAPLMSAVALTDRYVVVFDLPVTYDRAAAMAGAPVPYRARPGRPARIGLLPRRAAEGAQPRWFAIAACRVPAVVNAYDDGTRVVVDAIRDPLRARECASRVHRWTIDPAGGTVAERPLTGALTLPSVDPRWAGRGHHLVFGSTPDGHGLVGHDLSSGATTVRRLGPGRSAGRPVLVPRGREEGDGWMVVLTRDLAGHGSDLLVLDAADLDAPPRAVVHLTADPPEAQHTTWVTPRPR